jgi:hypothetical protein
MKTLVFLDNLKKKEKAYIQVMSYQKKKKIHISSEKRHFGADRLQK